MVSESSFDLIVDCLNKIDNDLQVAELCRDANLRENRILKTKVLKYALERLKKDFSVDQERKYLLFEDVSKVLYRLSTFEMVHDTETTESTYMVEIFLKFLDSREFGKAEIILVRHENEIVYELSQEFLKKIFEKFLKSTNFDSNFTEFLQNLFFPVVLRERPSLVDTVAEFLVFYSNLLAEIVADHDRTNKIDQSIVGDGNSLKFVVEFAKILHHVVEKLEFLTKKSSPAEISRLTFCLSTIHVNQPEENSNICQLNRLITNLNEFLHLQTVYDLKLPWGDFLKLNEESVCFRILDQNAAAVELFEDCMKNVVIPYCKEKKLDSDSVLTSYIQVVIF